MSFEGIVISALLPFLFIAVMLWSHMGNIY